MINVHGIPGSPPYDPLNFTALESLDFGEVYTPDGRAHPFDANTPVNVSYVSSPGGPGGATPLTALFPSLAVPQHFGARLAVGVLAIGVLLIVAFRLAK